MSPAEPSDHWLRNIHDCAMYRRTLRLTCPSCGAVRRLNAVGVWWLFSKRGWDLALKHASKRFRCTTCWERMGRIARPRIKVTRDQPEPSDGLPYPSEVEWKRVVSRYRC